MCLSLSKCALSLSKGTYAGFDKLSPHSFLCKPVR